MDGDLLEAPSQQRAWVIGLLMALLVLAAIFSLKASRSSLPITVTRFHVEELPRLVESHRGKIVVVDVWAMW